MTFKSVLLASALAFGATSAFAAEKYVLDASHSQIVFTYNHLGFSTTTSMFSGFDGEIMMDAGRPCEFFRVGIVSRDGHDHRLAGPHRSLHVR